MFIPMLKRLLLILNIVFLAKLGLSQNLFVVSEGNVGFTSDAPLELIQADTDDIQGVLKTTERSFAFRVKMETFRGFNNSLQRTHFQENYLETEKYPYTIFEGKIIEDINLYSPGEYNVRGKGKFTCHGVEKERIIKTKIEVKPDRISIKADFSILLADHNITIPSVVSQKLADEVSAEVEMILKPKQ